jgi:hypothetical protein
MSDEKVETTEAKKVSLTGEIYNWNPHADRVPETYWDVSPDSPVVTKMIPCPPCTWG